MKTRINARLLEGGTLDKLADGRLLDLNGKPVPKSRGGKAKKVGAITCDKEPGFYIRLNAKTYRHAFGVKTPMRDGVAGDNIIIGKIDETDLKDALAECREIYRNGKPGESASNKYTLDFCFAEWLADDPKRSSRTVDGVRRDLELFSADWRDKSVTDITTQEILARASTIRDGEFFSPTTEKNIGTHNVARRWLLSMSAIHNSAKLYHESFNGFEAVLAKYKKKDGEQRALTLEEITTILKFELNDTPRNGDLKPCPQKFLRMLSLKFQLLAGFRIGDVVSLRQSDIKTDDATGTRYIEHDASKGNRPHFLPMPKQLAKVIDDAIEIRDSHPSMSGSEFVFPHRDGGRFSNPRDSFDVARDLLVHLDLIRPEKVPGNGSRLMRSHDCRRTFRTHAIEELGVAESNVNSLLDHGESAMNKIYKLPTHEQRMTALARLLPDHEKLVDHLFKIASR